MSGHAWTPKIEAFIQEQFKSGDIKSQESAKSVFARHIHMLGQMKKTMLNNNFSRIKHECMLDGGGGECF